MEKPIIYEKLLETLNICVNQIEKSAVFEYKIDDNTVYNFKTKEIISENEIVKTNNSWNWYFWVYAR